MNANDVSTRSPTAETVLETGSDDDQDDVDLGKNARVNLSTKLSNASNEADSVCESGLRDLVMDTDEQGQPNFAITVGALGNGNGAPLDRTQDMSFGESAVRDLAVDGNEDERHDPCDPDVITMLTTRRNVSDPQSPTSMHKSLALVRFNDMVAGYPPENTTVNLGATSSTTTANAGGTGTTSTSQGNPQSLQSGTNAAATGNSNSNDSNGNNGSQGGASSGDDPQGPDPDVDPLEKVVFTHRVSGGPMAQWAIEG